MSLASLDEPLRFRNLKESAPAGKVRVRGAREHNLKNIDVDIPREMS